MMITPGSRLQVEAWRKRETPIVEDLGAGTWSIPIGNPSRPIRYVITYALESDHGLILIDCGWNNDAALEQLSTGLALAGYHLEDISLILITHAHPDHFGLAPRIRSASGAHVALHASDMAVLHAHYGGVAQYQLAIQHTLSIMGVPDRDWDGMVTSHLASWPDVPLVPDSFLEDGELLQLPGWGTLRSIWTPGHSPGHVCFVDEERQRLFSGDHLLPEISPSVGSHVEHHEDPLGDCIRSLQRLHGLEVCEVLPSHQYRYEGSVERIDALLLHHEERRLEIVDDLRERGPLTVLEIARTTKWSREWSTMVPEMKRAALGETFAHLIRLEREEAVCRVEPSKRNGWTIVKWHNSR